MDLKPLVCPQCGGQITDYPAGSQFVTCGYCSTRFKVEPEETSQIASPIETPDLSVSESDEIGRKIGVFVVGIAIFVVTMIIIGAVVASRNKTTVATTPTRSPNAAPARPGNSVGQTGRSFLLSFGEKGTENGQFKDADSIAVDKHGRIYVGDGTMRVQQFDPDGRYLKTIQVPSEGANYSKARSINKIAVADDGRIFIAVGGVILVYAEQSSSPSKTIQVAPDYIQDFALKNDGSLLAISDAGDIETMLFVNKSGGITRRVRGFHTDALDAAISPQETAVAAIRVAVDGTGNIYSVYAFAALGSYSISSNNDELLIARFTPQGKFVKKFVQSMDSCGIQTDNKGRVYISRGSVVEVYDGDGNAVNSVPLDSSINAFALDRSNNVYAVLGDKVVKSQGID